MVAGARLLSHKKKFYRLPTREDGEKWTAETAKALTLDQVKAIIEEGDTGSIWQGDTLGSLRASICGRHD